MKNRSELLRTIDFKNDRFGTAERGENPTYVARMRSGFVFMMDYQFLPGWCVLLATPGVSCLNSLSRDKRTEFLEDMHLLGEVIEQVTEPVRMNYSILGNNDPYLHAHVYPRYDWEDEARLKKPAWRYFEGTEWVNENTAFGEKHFELADKIGYELEKALQETDAYR